MATKTIKIREEWLLNLAKSMEPSVAEASGVALPPFRVTCGWPSTGGRGRKRRVRGECWAATASADGHAEIFISPQEADTKEVAAILCHELIHAALPNVGHKKPFQAAAKKLGFVAPFTGAVITNWFDIWVNPILDKIGDYPHAELMASSAIAKKKKQVARQLLCYCETCGYKARVARSWLESAGPPHCPQHGQMIFSDPNAEDIAQQLAA